MASRSVTSVRIPLTRPLELLQTHISATICQTVFATVRTRERQRAWTLELLVQFWLAVVLRAPRALTQALALKATCVIEVEADLHEVPPMGARVNAVRRELSVGAPA